MPDRKRGDFILIFTVAILVIFGIIMVFSASYYTALNSEGDAYYYLKRVLAWAGLGTLVMIAASFLPYKLYGKVNLIILGVAFLLLAVALWTPLGVSLNGARRWIGVGSITFMPGELAKPALIIFIAHYYSSNPARINKFLKGIVVPLGVTALFALMIMLQPNMSTAITLCLIVACIMFAAGMSWKYIISFGAVGAGLIVALIAVEPYRLQRWTSFLDPFGDALNTGFQTVQSLLALGSGGLFGVGIGRSIQKTLYLPEPMNDYILAIIGEELGFIGCIFLIVAYAIVIWRGIHIALNAKDTFGRLLATGITAMIAIQVVLNLAVVTSSMPSTGVALPFISYGGNTLAILMGSAGILVNISKNSIQY